VSKDECFFYVSTSIDVRSEFIDIIRECNQSFVVEDGQDFIAYYRAEDIRPSETEIRFSPLPRSIDDALEEIETVVDNVKLGIVIAKIKVEILKKTPLFLLEILKKMAMS
jgi:hypothetical protein